MHICKHWWPTDLSLRHILFQWWPVSYKLSTLPFCKMGTHTDPPSPQRAMHVHDAFWVKGYQGGGKNSISQLLHPSSNCNQVPLQALIKPLITHVRQFSIPAFIDGETEIAYRSGEPWSGLELKPRFLPLFVPALLLNSKLQEVTY